MKQLSFFPDQRQNATDEDVVAIFRTAVARTVGCGGCGAISDDVAAEHQIHELNVANREVVQPGQIRLAE